MNEAKKNELYDRYENSTHLLGRLGTAAAILLLLAVPMAMGWVLNASPDWKAFGVGFAQVALIYWTSGVVEFLVYAPMLGSGASYLTFITGNAVNLKLPCAVNAREICGTQVGTPENDIVSTLSVATSSLVTTLVLAVGVLCLVPLRPVLENPALAPAFNNVIPALFGALAFKYFSKSLKLAAAPLAFTAWATPTICASLSTEQGPAMTAKLPPPTFTPLTSTTVSSGWNLRLAFL